MQIGDTFLSPTPKSSERHLYCIITNPDNNGMVIIVNVTKKKITSDTTCILKIGDHPFIYTESVINYSEAALSPIQAIENAIQTNDSYSIHERLKPEILEKIIHGARIGEFLPRKYYPYFGRE